MGNWLERNRSIVLVLLVNLAVIGGLFFFIIPYLDIYGLIIVRGVQVMFLAAWVLSTALITEYIPDTKGTGIGKYYLFMSIGWFMAGMSSGTIYRYDIDIFFFLLGFVVIAQGLLLLPLEEPRRKSANVTLKNVFHLERIKEIKVLFVSVFLLAMGIMSWLVLIPVYFEDTFNYTRDIVTVIIAWSSLPFLLTIYLMGQLCDKYGRKKMYIASIFTYMVMFAGFALEPHLFILLTLWILPAYGFYLISTTAMVADLTHPHERARGMGLQGGAVNLGSFAGAIVGGAVYAWSGSYPVLFSFAFIFPVLALVVGVGLKETLDCGVSTHDAVS